MHKKSPTTLLSERKQELDGAFARQDCACAYKILTECGLSRAEIAEIVINHEIDEDCMTNRGAGINKKWKHAGEILRKYGFSQDEAVHVLNQRAVGTKPAIVNLLIPMAVRLIAILILILPSVCTHSANPITPIALIPLGIPLLIGAPRGTEFFLYAISASAIVGAFIATLVTASARWLCIFFALFLLNIAGCQYLSYHH